jgi:hypothetical protein
VTGDEAKVNFFLDFPLDLVSIAPFCSFFYCETTDQDKIKLWKYGTIIWHETLWAALEKVCFSRPVFPFVFFSFSNYSFFFTI